MKIAIASEGKNVSGHFGHCEGFTIYQTEGNNIYEKTFVENPGHKPGFLPKFLKNQDVHVIISGGMGASAQELFKDANIDVVVGANGDCDNVIKEYVNGNLLSTESVCHEHKHEGHCNG